MRSALVIAILAAVLGCAGASAADGHDRRLAAELAIMSGDAQRLAAGQGGPLEREGLARRLGGALSSLPLLLRRSGNDGSEVADLRTAHGRKDWRALAAKLALLARRHPFDAGPLVAAAATAEALALGESIHRTTCAGCHDAPGGDSLLPAKNLSRQLEAVGATEFAARLLLGVRGDRSTNLGNPFSESELAALIAFYAGAGQATQVVNMSYRQIHHTTKGNR